MRHPHLPMPLAVHCPAGALDWKEGMCPHPPRRQKLGPERHWSDSLPPTPATPNQRRERSPEQPPEPAVCVQGGHWPQGGRAEPGGAAAGAERTFLGGLASGLPAPSRGCLVGAQMVNQAPGTTPHRGVPAKKGQGGLRAMQKELEVPLRLPLWGDLKRVAPSPCASVPATDTRGMQQ